MGELLWNSVRLMVAGIVLSAVLGLAAAWVVERTDVPLRRMWHALMCAPLAGPGLRQRLRLGLADPLRRGLLGRRADRHPVVLPLVYLPVSAMLRGLDPALEEVAQSLGYGGLRRFVLRRAAGAASGTARRLRAGRAAPARGVRRAAMLRYNTFTTAIYDQYESTFAGPAANMLASVLVLLCLRAAAHRAVAARAGPLARVGRGAARQLPPVALGWAKPRDPAGVAALVVWRWACRSAAWSAGCVVGSLDDVPGRTGWSGTSATTIGLSLAAGSRHRRLRRAHRVAVGAASRCESTILERCTYIANALRGSWSPWRW